jgi:DNA-3-methyladenine glycosylase II
MARLIHEHPDFDPRAFLAQLPKMDGFGTLLFQIIGQQLSARPDAFPAGDLALRRAVKRLYGLDHLPSESELLGMAERWRPYRSLAAAYLFESEFG